MRDSSDLPAAPESFEGLRGALADLVEPEQPGIVMHAEHQGIDFECELGGVGIAAQVPFSRSLCDRLLQFAAPTSLLLHHLIVQRTISSIVFAGRGEQNAAALVLAAPF